MTKRTVEQIREQYRFLSSDHAHAVAILLAALDASREAHAQAVRERDEARASLAEVFEHADHEYNGVTWWEPIRARARAAMGVPSKP